MNIRGTCLLALGALVTSTSVSAASLHVSPVSLNLDSRQMAVGLTLTNPSEQPLVAQVRIFAWGQNGGNDELLQQQDVVVSPPIAMIPAHSDQVVRVIRLASGTVGAELAYRLLIDELPDSAINPGAVAVNIRLRYSIPLFIAPATSQPGPSVSWRLSEHDGSKFLTASNAGGIHAQISAARFLLADGTTVPIADGLLGYALTGRTREWQLPATLDRQQLAGARIQANVNSRPVVADVAPAGAQPGR